MSDILPKLVSIITELLFLSLLVGVEADMSDKDSDLGSMSISHRLPVSDSSHRLCPSNAFGDMSQLSGKSREI